MRPVVRVPEVVDVVTDGSTIATTVRGMITTRYADAPGRL